MPITGMVIIVVRNVVVVIVGVAIEVVVSTSGICEQRHSTE